jgi:hypothetical protein
MGDHGQRNGVVKIQLQTEKEKIEVLRNKSQLKANSKYTKVYLRSSQTHGERLMHRNMQSLISCVPQLHHLKLLNNGYIVTNMDNPHFSSRNNFLPPRQQFYPQQDFSQGNRQTDTPANLRQNTQWQHRNYRNQPPALPRL